MNTSGEIIGINVAIASANSMSSSSAQPGNIGVGFSIPINDAKSVAQEIIATGAATHGQLGLSVRAKASGTASGFTAGAEVAAVTQGGAADKAGDATLGAATAGLTPLPGSQRRAVRLRVGQNDKL